MVRESLVPTPLFLSDGVWKTLMSDAVSESRAGKTEIVIAAPLYSEDFDFPHLTFSLHSSLQTAEKCVPYSMNLDWHLGVPWDSPGVKAPASRA